MRSKVHEVSRRKMGRLAFFRPIGMKVKLR